MRSSGTPAVVLISAEELEGLQETLFVVIVLDVKHRRDAYRSS